jgi:hypothetical protein
MRRTSPRPGCWKRVDSCRSPEANDRCGSNRRVSPGGKRIFHAPVANPPRARCGVVVREAAGIEAARLQGGTRLRQQTDALVYWWHDGANQRPSFTRKMSITY